MPNPEMQRAFSADPAAKLPRRRAERVRRQQKRRRKPVRAQSVTQAKREAFLAGQKASLLSGGARECARCPRSFETFDEAWAGLDLHHEVKRGQGKGYRGGKQFGVDDPRNLELVCRPCHRQLESNPEWSAV